MRSIPVDLDVEQVVRWMMREQQTAPSELRIVARQIAEPQTLPREARHRLGDEEREDLSEVATIATLEISPAHAAEGWRLTVQVEDESGPRFSGGEDAGDEEIEVGQFYDDFIRPGRGSATVTAEVEDAVAESRLKTLLHSIETDRHAPSGRV